MNEKPQSLSGISPETDPCTDNLLPTLGDSVRQLAYPREWRIEPPTAVSALVEAGEMVGAEAQAEPSEASAKSVMADSMVAELATCLWYLKTKHFKREWKSDDTSDDDPRVRRALGRVNRGIDALAKYGVEIDDPTNRRYPQGGENMMKPIEFQPTDGLTFEKVTETVRPIVYRDDRLLQRGEVFVAVPRQKPAVDAEPDAVPSNHREAQTNGDKSPRRPGDKHKARHSNSKRQK